MSNIKCYQARDRKIIKVYMAWKNMLQRCNNPKSKYYKNYGGRGIKVCNRWLKLENFLVDMGKSPEGLILDRINNNGNYEPDNCRWTDRKTSNRNSRLVKLSIKKVTEIRKLYSEGYKQRKIAEKFNICNQHVSRIINNKRWN